jgi:hypothetical protein
MLAALALAILANSSAQPAPKPGAPSATILGIQDTRFTLNGKPTFLLGASYYGALGASEAAIRKDLDNLQGHGFNWIRVWATWAAFDNDVSAVDAAGAPREAHLRKLEWLVAECDRRRMIVDVTLSRGNGISGSPRLQTQSAHRRAVETIATVLKPHRNWYLDFGNERNIGDARFVSFEDLKQLHEVVRSIDPDRLVTASQGGDINREELRDYLLTARVAFISPHRPRHAKSPGETDAKTREYLAWMNEIGRTVPVHFQEPFRRGYGPQSWDPRADDFTQDLSRSKSGGAAGWCFHNGDQRDTSDHQPRRSFDLRERRLFENLDAEERQFLALLLKAGNR